MFNFANLSCNSFFFKQIYIQYRKHISTLITAVFLSIWLNDHPHTNHWRYFLKMQLHSHRLPQACQNLAVSGQKATFLWSPVFPMQTSLKITVLITLILSKSVLVNSAIS